MKASVWLVGEDGHTGTVAPAGAALLHRAEDDRGGDQESRGAGAGGAAAAGVSNCLFVLNQFLFTSFFNNFANFSELAGIIKFIQIAIL